MANKKSNFPTSRASVPPEKMGEDVSRFKNIMNLAPCKKSNPEGIKQRLNEMFEFCSIEGVKPTVELMTAYLGVSRMALLKWQREDCEAGRLIETAKGIINAMMTEWAMCGEVAFPFVIWNQKNNYGYSENVNITATNGAEQTLDSLPEKEEIIKRLPILPQGEKEPGIDDIIENL